jgi:carboxymethylenebutenolidase
VPTTASIMVDGSPMDIYVDAPAQGAPWPTIVLMYHRDGIDAFTKGVAAKLAAGGYLVAAPDVAHRSPPELSMKARKDYLRDRDIVADIRATLDFLRARADVDKKRLVLMGHCMGGRMAMLGAGHLADFRALVVCYGGGVHKAWGDGPPPLDTLRNIRCPVIGFYGNDDNNPSPEDVDRMDTELTRHGVAHTFHRYDNAGHGFQNRNPGTPGERAAAEHSWSRTFAFLKTTLA